MKKLLLIVVLLGGCVDVQGGDGFDAGVECTPVDCIPSACVPVECQDIAREMVEAIKLLRVLYYEPSPWRVTALIEIAHDYDECIIDHASSRTGA